MRCRVAYWMLGLVAGVSVAVSAQSVTDADFIQFRDKEFRFSIRYPRTWARVEPTYSETRFKAVSEGGDGEDDLSVVVTKLEGAGQLTAEDFVKAINARAYLKQVQKILPDAKLVKHCPTTIGNQAAYYFETDVIHRVLDVEFCMRQIQVQTVRNGNVYTITYRTDPERSAFFFVIAAGFVLWPD